MSAAAFTDKPEGPMSERDVSHLGGLPVYTNPWLPVGGFWCHPDTLKLGAADVERIVEGLKAAAARGGEPPKKGA